jgi:hypothetical protein
MNQEDFVENVIRGSLRESISRSAEESLRPDKPHHQGSNFEKLNQIGAWYSKLTSEEKEVVALLLRNTIDFSIWEFMYLFSYPSIGQIRAEHGHLELFHVSENGERTLLSGDFDKLQEMHEMYHSGPDFPSWILHGKAEEIV